MKRNQYPLTPEIRKALEHVRIFFPKVVKVHYNKWGCWRFTYASGYAPDFQRADIDYAILEDAQWSAYCPGTYYWSMTSYVSECLATMEATLSKPGVWIKYHAAENSTGAEVHYASDEACKFCLMGAMGKAISSLNITGIEKVSVTHMVLDQLVEAFIEGTTLKREDYGSLDLAHFNDTRTNVEQVLDLIKRAKRAVERDRE